MKYRILVIFLIAVLTLISCNVQERIVFNQDMGGSYSTNIDLSTMMQFAESMAPPSEEEREEKETAIDTTIVFSEFLEEYKDSIATLSDEERNRIEKLKDFNLHMQIDKDNGVFAIDIGKEFDDFSGLERIAYETSDVMNFAKNQEEGNQGLPPQLDNMLTADKVAYSFDGNIFRRKDVDEGAPNEMEDLLNGDIPAEFQELLENSYIKLEYAFSKEITAALPQEYAIISDDRKSVIYKLDWKKMLEDDTVLNSIEVRLEE